MNFRDGGLLQLIHPGIYEKLVYVIDKFSFCPTLLFCKDIIFCRYDKGAYLFLPSYIMRTHGAKQQREAVKRVSKKQIEPVFEVR